MAPLEPPDHHHLRAAEGWLELGNTREAEAELAKVASAWRSHPVVLETRWRIHAEQKQWGEALAVAQEMVRVAPEDSAGWIDRSFALHELKRTAEAWDLLLPAAGTFPQTSIIAYNLACYACQLGRSDEAQRWLAKAVAIRNKEEIKRMALRDADLRPLWPEIAKW